MREVPALRRHLCNRAPVRPEGRFVLYWMHSARRATWNFGLDRALEWAHELRKPLVVLEALRAGYPWACARFHRFVIDGMKDNEGAFSAPGVRYYPYVEPRAGKGKGLLAALGAEACVVVTDDYPCFFLPRAVAAAARQIDVRMEQVDSNGILPLRAAERVFTTAFSFRRVLQAELPWHLDTRPYARPRWADLPRASRTLTEEIERRWPRADLDEVAAAPPVPKDIGPIDERGGMASARARWRHFREELLPRYGEARNDPDRDGSSGLSPFLHFGHISSHELLHDILQDEEWTDAQLGRATGKRRGWWGFSEGAEAFLDQLVTWRELGFNMCSQTDDYDQYGSLPEWARTTLAEHEDDERPHLYELEEFDRAATHDDLWNAAQRQLVREGRMHNYLRMLWGKKILEWSPSPRAALDVMIELNNKYALDGRDPNSYSGIFWVLGRYDRAWGPERPIFGKIRFMSSDNTRRKLDVKGYLERYGE